MDNPTQPTTIGDLERLAGIGPDHEARFAFWQPFAGLGTGALDAGVAELTASSPQNRSPAHDDPHRSPH
jgi:hypothetical protein